MRAWVLPALSLASVACVVSHSARGRGGVALLLLCKQHQPAGATAAANMRNSHPGGQHKAAPAVAAHSAAEAVRDAVSVDHAVEAEGEELGAVVPAAVAALAGGGEEVSQAQETDKSQARRVT